MPFQEHNLISCHQTHFIVHRWTKCAEHERGVWPRASPISRPFCTTKDGLCLLCQTLARRVSNGLYVKCHVICYIFPSHLTISTRCDGMVTLHLLRPSRIRAHVFFLCNDHPSLILFIYKQTLSKVKQTSKCLSLSFQIQKPNKIGPRPKRSQDDKNYNNQSARKTQSICCSNGNNPSQCYFCISSSSTRDVVILSCYHYVNNCISDFNFSVITYYKIHILLLFITKIMLLI